MRGSKTATRPAVASRNGPLEGRGDHNSGAAADPIAAAATSAESPASSPPQ